MLKIKRFPVLHWRFREQPISSRPNPGRLSWLRANVPGSVHLDLIANGVIPHPHERLYEKSVEWVDQTSWVYQGTFEIRHLPQSPTFLVFHGLDTIAEIRLNGELLGNARNMFVPHEFEVNGKLLMGHNTVEVIFHPCQPAQPGSYRKARYMSGGDYSPKLGSCGIFKRVEITTVPVARICAWKWAWRMDGDLARIKFSVDIERTAHVDQNIGLNFEIHGVGNILRQLRDPLPSPVTVDIPAGHGIFTANRKSSSSILIYGGPAIPAIMLSYSRHSIFLISALSTMPNLSIMSKPNSVCEQYRSRTAAIQPNF